MPNPITTLSRRFAPERQETHPVVQRNVDASDSGRLLLPASVKVDRVNLLQGVHDAGLTGDIFGSSQLQDGRDTISMIRSEPLYPAALIIRLKPATLCDPCCTQIAEFAWKHSLRGGFENISPLVRTFGFLPSLVE